MRQPSRLGAWLSGAVAAVLVAAGAIWLTGAGAKEPEVVAGPFGALIEKLRPLHQVKTPARGNDWLVDHPEEGQTFGQYVKSNPNRPTTQRTTIYIQPWGEFDAAQKRLVEDTAQYMQRFFNRPVKQLPAMRLESIPASARRVHPTWRVKQILSQHVLETMQGNRPKDAVAVIALTTSDLWPGEGWNFVFGEASLTERVGVWSLARLGDPDRDYALVLRRTLQTATHETGHMLGIEHCTAYECCMNGSNSLEESDRAPLAFCPVCDAKILWACGGDARKRFLSLAEFAKGKGLVEGAAFWIRSAAILGK